jgi:hypothetical protein
MLTRQAEIYIGAEQEYTDDRGEQGAAKQVKTLL